MNHAKTDLHGVVDLFHSPDDVERHLARNKS